MTSRSQVNYETRRGGSGTRGNLSDNSGEKSSNYGSGDSSIGDEYYEKNADYDSPERMIFAQEGDSDGEEDSLMQIETVQEGEEELPPEKDENDSRKELHHLKYKEVGFGDFEFKLNSRYNEEDIIEKSLKYWKKQGNIAANTLRGVVNHFPPAPNANEVGPSEAEQSIYAKELEEWRRACNEYNAAILKINDTHRWACVIRI